MRHGGDVLESVSSQLHSDGHIDWSPALPLDPAGQDDTVPDGLSARILEALSPTPLPIADIARASQCSARQCAALLMELEIDGKALTHAGGLASRA